MKPGDWVVRRRADHAHYVVAVTHPDALPCVYSACGLASWEQWLRPAIDADPRCKRCQRAAEKKANLFCKTG